MENITTEIKKSQGKSVRFFWFDEHANLVTVLHELNERVKRSGRAYQLRSASR